jgi:hypothetical protein
MPGRESTGRDRDRRGWCVSAVDRGVAGQGRGRDTVNESGWVGMCDEGEE